MDSLIKVHTDDNIYIISPVSDYYDDRIYYGYVIRLSIDVGYSEKWGSHTGFYYYFDERPVRIVPKNKVIKIETLSDLDKAFVHELKLRKSGRIGYSQKVLDQFNLYGLAKIYIVEDETE